MSSTTAAAEEPATGRRRALVVGVGRTEFLERDPALAERFPRLGFVDRDVVLVGAALADSGYTVDALHPGHPLPERRDTGVGAIVSAVEEFLLSCTAGDTAFLYVSAHGVTVGEREYLLTSDARPRADGSLIAQTILETAPEVLLGPLPVGVTVVVCLDTCRTDQPPFAADSHETPLASSAYRDVAWLRASGRGQPAYADPEKGSYFGIALSEALSPNSPPKTFKDVHAFVRARIERLTARLTEPPPTVESQCVEGLADRLVVCRGSEETQRWTEAITGSVLWRHTSHDADVHERVKDRLADLAREVSKSRLGTDSALATPWSDPEYPIRVVDRLGRLVEAARLTGRERLSPAETAALLAAPLLHEGVVAVALSELAALRPDRIDRREEDRGREAVTAHDQLVCDAARDVSRAHSQVSLAAETLRRRHLPEPATAADHWLRHRFIADWDRLWDHTGDYAAVDHLLAMVVAALTAGSPDEPSPQSRTLIDRQIRQVLAHVTVAPGSSPRINDSGELRWNEHPAVPGNTWRARYLAYLVWLASLLAADPRRMSSVLVDHLGAHRRLVPSDVIAALSEYRLVSPEEPTGTDTGGGYDLAVNFLCPHPALHAAVEELAATADASVRALHKGWKEDRTPAPDLLRGIPRKVTTEFLEPLEQQYTKPLERFRLAEDEIRPLLMGTQLYGDKMLAVRELYQNALDACRHRQLRVEYGRRLSKCGGKGREPEISFVQGYDEDRPYIECHDTGTGMSRRKLTSMFARAGKRYEQDPDFVQERRNWRRAGIEPVAFNSRFGIGVFSYFMLAEEVVVTTSTIDLHGNPSRTEAPLQATIQSGSGLLEIVETTDAPEHGGTVVRLYLSADGETPPSLVETLRKLLWVSDHRVKAEEFDREGNKIRSAEWAPGELRTSSEWPTGAARAGTDAWIVQGKGQLLLDGVVIRKAPEVDGYVFNLRERDQPVPTVDRNGLIGYDEEGVERRLLAAVPEAVGSFEEVSLRWLWELAGTEPKLTVSVFDALPADATGVLHPTHEEHILTSSTFRIRDVGCLPFDEAVMRLTRHRTLALGRPITQVALQRWRSSLLGVLRKRDEPFTPEGYPEPIGLDALLFERSVPDGSWGQPLRVAAMTGESLAVAVRAQRRFAVVGMRVPEIPDVRSLRSVFPTVVMADLADAHTDVNAFRTGYSGPRPAVFAPALAVAADHGIALAEALSSARELTDSVPLSGWETVPQLDEGVVTEAEVLGLVGGRDRYARRGSHGWHKGVVHPVDLLVRAPSLKERESLVRRIDDLKDMGFSLGPAVSPATLGHRALTGDERRLLSKGSTGEPPWVDGALTMLDVLERSSSMSIPVGSVVEKINGITAATGVSAPAVPDDVVDWTAPAWLSGLFPGPDEISDLVGPWRVIGALQRARTFSNIDATPQDLRNLDACGVLAPGCLALVESVGEALAQDDRLAGLFSVLRSSTARTNSTWDLDAKGVALEPLVQLAARERTTLGEQAELLSAMSLPVPLKITDVPVSLQSFSPHAKSGFLFEGAITRKLAFRTELTCQQLLAEVRHPHHRLGDIVRVALAFHPYGGPALPGPFEGPDADVLEDFIPDDFDRAAFGGDLLGAGVLGPLELVLVAGRFDRTLGWTYERYAPFRCLGLDVTVQEPVGAERDLVPDWRDVIVLTARLTGRAPAVEDSVDPDHITLCAEETDLSEAQVLTRFRTYSRLFDLDLPDLDLPDPGGTRP
ncbi:caspase family protein [Streptomyces exfoliatus]|uniref:Caspase family protein n=1 Tax=Streptomyces exfoliatus TaxID=1905 RepID=A0ABV3CYC5_STREX